MKLKLLALFLFLSTLGFSQGLFDTPERELAPVQGRWLSPDPAHSGWNAYAYSTNPLGTTDATGGQDDAVDAVAWMSYSGYGGGADTANDVPMSPLCMDMCAGSGGAGGSSSSFSYYNPGSSYSSTGNAIFNASVASISMTLGPSAGQFANNFYTKLQQTLSLALPSSFNQMAGQAVYFAGVGGSGGSGFGLIQGGRTGPFLRTFDSAVDDVFTGQMSLKFAGEVSYISKSKAGTLTAYQDYEKAMDAKLESMYAQLGRQVRKGDNPALERQLSKDIYDAINQSRSVPTYYFPARQLRLELETVEPWQKEPWLWGMPKQD